MSREAELRARLYLMQKEVEQRYKAALTSQFEAVNLAGRYFQGFARGKPKPCYRLESEFGKVVEAALADPLPHAQAIDGDVKGYWKAVYEGVLDRHQYLEKEFNKYFKKGDQEKHRIYLEGHPGLNDLLIAEEDLTITFRNLPQYDFTGPEDTRYWESWARICVPVVNEAYEVHNGVAGSVMAIKAARKEKINKRYGMLGRAASMAVSVGRGFVGAPG